MRHTSYGTLQGRFEGTGGDFLRRAWFLWLLAAPAALLILPLPFLYGAFKAIEWRWRVSNVRFGDVQLQSDLKWSSLIGCYWQVIGWFVLRSEERRVGKEGVSTGRSWWSPDH